MRSQCLRRYGTSVSEAAMEMLFYLLLAVVLYGLMADRTDQAFEREMRKRRVHSDDLYLVEDPDAGLDLHPRDRWLFPALLSYVRLRATRAPRGSRSRAMAGIHREGVRRLDALAPPGGACLPRGSSPRRVAQPRGRRTAWSLGCQARWPNEAGPPA